MRYCARPLPWVLALLVASVAVSHAALQGQQPFRTATEIVPIYATVTDRDGRLVPDLTKANFEVRDNGQVQPITVFSNEIQPITIIIVLDRSGSMMPHSDVVLHAAETFVRQLLPDDRVRIADFGLKILIRPTDFINDRGALLDILHNELQTYAHGPSPIWTSFQRASAALSTTSGRRVVLAFTDGHDEPSENQPKTTFDEMLTHVLSDEVMVYAIGCEAEEAGGAFIINGRMMGMTTRTAPPDKHLKQLAEATGGGYFAFDWAQNLNEQFARVAEELHHQYLLGFVPQRLDGKTHQIELRVNEPGLKARARKSYVADRKTSS
jgi:Ca-activated chloride channel family protein